LQTYSRPVSAHEWWGLGIPEGLVTEVQLCVEGDGSIDPAALAAAVAVASEACPGARLVRRGQEWVDSGQPPPVRVVDGADFDRERLDSPVLHTPLGAEEEPSCEVVLVQGAPATVIFRAGPMDGRGAMLWQREVFRALRGEDVEGATGTLASDEVKAEIAAKLGIDLPAAAEASGPAWRSVLGPLPGAPRRSLWRRRTIDGIHLGVTAKIARLVARCGGPEGLVGIPVDMRPFMPGMRTTVGVTGMLKVHVREADDWKDVDARLFAALSEHQFLAHRSDATVLTMPMSLIRELRRWVDDMAMQNEDAVRERKLEDQVAVVSHLGAVDLDGYSAGGFHATSCYSLGSVAWAPEFDIVENRGQTEITVAWRDGPGVAERIEALLDQIEEELSPRAHRVWDGNRTDRETPPDTLTGLFAAQVRRTPDAVAISSTDGDLSYAELNERAAAIAAALDARGIGRGDRVGLVAGRSAAAIAAIWGILKAGAAYLPIDASYPDARITQILSGAQLAVCLLEPPGDERACLPPGISLEALPRTAPRSWREAAGQPDDLACVIFTSGSTGAPKGVEIEHRSLVNYVRWATREAGLDAGTKMPLIASISFDMAGCAIFLPLLAGGTVLPVRAVDAVTLREVLEDGGATALAITPSHLDLINAAGVRRSTMRVVMTAGELLRRSTAIQAQKIFGPQCKILCQWGPTETTIVNTSHEFNPERDTDAGVPFGRPMDNNTVYLLDAQGRFAAPGEPGEAYVGGVQVARGYLGRPDLTRQRFVRLADGTRVYRTGDIARLLPSGELAFVSRADDQVKVAGHRIEPAEVTQALEDHPGVQQATVIARSRPGREDKELCGYVVGADLAPEELKQFLAGRLPQYMIPAAIIAVPEIPRTANGKTDVRQLPDPFSGTSGGDVPVPDRDEVTAAVARIWAHILQADAHLIDEQTDFRQLGGNSLLLLAMINEVSRSVVGRRHAEFMAQLALIIREPTLGRVSEVARQTRRASGLLGRLRR
jgi:amino acid adenylation domain-containing protein